MADSTTWYCEAYGPELVVVGALCFIAEPGKRLCADADECHRVMTAQRQRVWQRVNELAAEGDAVGVDLAEAFPRPEQILGGGEDDPEPGTTGR